MSEYTYKQILAKAKSIKTNVEKNYKLGEYTSWGYYIAKEILKPKTNITVIKIASPDTTKADHISRQILAKDFKDMAKRYTNYVEKHNKTPNYITLGAKKVGVLDYIYMFARILLYWDTHNQLPKYANVNSKAFIKPTETGNVVYDYVAKKTGRKFKTIDDVLEYVQKHGRYIFEFDDVRSNKQVTDCMCGNCTDWLQWLWNMAEAMGYDCRAVHVKCRVSGTGHVRGQFKHPVNTGGKWIDRDPAAVADGGSITSIWCSDGYVLAINPSWFLANLRR